MKPDRVKSMVDGLERQFLEGFDPFFHYVTLEAMSNGVLDTFQIQNDEGDELLDHEIIRQLQASEKKRSDHISSLARVFRYFAAETLVLLIVSGPPFGPFARAASTLRYDEMNKVFDDLANRKVPRKFHLSRKNRAFDFTSWLSYRISGDPDWMTRLGRHEIANLVVEEAEMLRSRGAINAFKHGKPFSFGTGFKMTLTHPETGKTVSNVPLDGINWIEWSEKKPSLEISYHTEEIIPEEDKARIFLIALLSNAIRNYRLARMNGEQNVELTFPHGFTSGKMVRRQSMKIRLSPSEEGKK
ncbi:MAG: hypothetical protein Q8J98_06400 [Phaeovulum sp.]|uniref:hypothetical protein n=1 Tax=Phaeovulum sp. TaxID=2934796 RepID=UPI00272FB4CF|nr:hypothetical protein [Phaeovulum sp.]MDP2062725.1 hypothetical protein [Phaeovulum sp.]